jgi:hypothetical protein
VGRKTLLPSRLFGSFERLRFFMNKEASIVEAGKQIGITDITFFSMAQALWWNATG